MKKRTDLTGAFKLDPVYLKHSHQDSGKLGACSCGLFPYLFSSELHLKNLRARRWPFKSRETPEWLGVVCTPHSSFLCCEILRAFNPSMEPALIRTGAEAASGASGVARGPQCRCRYILQIRKHLYKMTALTSIQKRIFMLSTNTKRREESK